MFAEGNDELVKQAAKNEYNAVVKKYGEKYHSLHEAYSVLLEEYEEASEILDFMKNKIGYIWTAIKENEINRIEKILDNMRLNTIQITLEAMQVYAVCKRFSNTLQDGGKND